VERQGHSGKKSRYEFTKSQYLGAQLLRDKQLRRTYVRTLLIRFRRDESGATAIEYGLIAAGIAAAIIVVVNTLGTNVNTAFTNISSQLK